MDNNEMNTQNGQYSGQENVQYQQPTGQYQQPMGQYQQPSGQYQQPVQQPNYNYSQTINNYNQTLEEPMSLGEWLVCLLVMLIPCVNIIMMFVWAFADGKKSKQNFFRAQLIMAGILIVLYIVLLVIFGASMVSMINNLSYYY